MQRAFWIVLLVCGLAGAPSLWCEASPSTAARTDLPDAPEPAQRTTASQPVNIGAAPQVQGPGVGAIRYAPLYARTIFPGETARHLTVKNKFLYSGRQMVEPVNLLPALLSAGWSQYQNSDPRYGTDSYAFGQRFGAAIAREDSDRLFTDAVLPVVLHEDPRYYRLGSGSSDVRRTTYALTQVFVTRTDNGRKVPNYSGFLGRGMAIALTFAYYPAASRSGGVALRDFGTSVGGLAVFDLLREFVPREVFSHLTIFREPDVAAEPASR